MTSMPREDIQVLDPGRAGHDGMMNKWRLLLVILIILIPGISMLDARGVDDIMSGGSRGPEDELDVPFGSTTVNLDGIKGSGEWDDAARKDTIVGGKTLSIYHKQDGARLYLALQYPEDSVCDIAFDIDNNGGDLPQTDDLQIHVSLEKWEWRGTSTKWEFATVSGWDANLGWSTFREIRIDFSKLSISTGSARTMGIAVDLMTSSEDYFWPSDAFMDKPSTWGSIYSTGLWKAPPVNNPPILSEGDVDPMVGVPGADFNFTVTYQDDDGDQPPVRNVVIDGTSYEMFGTGSAFNDPVGFYRTLKMNEGVHSYHFLFSDGKDDSRLPPEGNFTGPYVREDNTPPILLGQGIPNGTYFVDEDSGPSYGLIDLESHFSDDNDDGRLSFEIVHQEDASIMRCEVNGSKLDLFLTEPDWFGALEFQVKAVDRGVIGPSGYENVMETLSNPFLIEVRPVNDQPSIIRIGDMDVADLDEVVLEGTDSAVEDQIFSLVVDVEDVDIESGAGDIIGSQVNASYVTLSTIDQHSVELSFTPDNEQVGWVHWNLTVIDGKGGEDWKNIRILVKNVNDDPEFVSYTLRGEEILITGREIILDGDRAAREDEWYNFTVKAFDPDHLIGIEDPLLFHISSQNEWITVDQITGEISFLPGQDDVGMVEFNLSVMDWTGTEPDDIMHFHLQVINTNDPPMIQDVVSTSGKFEYVQGEEGTISVFTMDPDLGHDPLEELRIDWSSDIDGALGTGPSLNTSSLSVGSHNITVRVEDKGGEVREFSFPLLITARFSPQPAVGGRGADNLMVLMIIAVSIFFTAIAAWLVLFVHMRVREKNILDNLRRKMIFELIKKKPGIHFMAIQEGLDLSIGVLSHHLNLLEKYQFVRSIQDGKYRRFYLYEEKIEYKLRLNYLQQMILFIVKKDPGISQSQISREIGRNKMVVNYHIRILMDIGLVSLEKEGRETHCFITNTGSRYISA